MSDAPPPQITDKQEADTARQEPAPDADPRPTEDVAPPVVGTVAGTTGPTPLTGGQIVDTTEGDTDQLI